MQYFSIDFISKLFNLNSSKIRFWEKKQLFNPIRAKNNYRQYDLKDIISIANIINFQKMNFPLSKIREINTNATPESLKINLNEALINIEAEMNELVAAKKRILHQKEKIKEFEELQNKNFWYEKPNFKQISNLENFSLHTLQKRIQTDLDYVILFQLSNNQIISTKEGLLGNSSSTADAFVLPNNAQYLNFIFKSEHGQPLNNNLHPILKFFDSENLKIDFLICKYLLSIKDDPHENKLDIYHAFAKIAY